MIETQRAALGIAIIIADDEKMKEGGIHEFIVCLECCQMASSKQTWGDRRKHRSTLKCQKKWHRSWNRGTEKACLTRLS